MSGPRTVLVLNCGSSSLKYAVVEPDSGRQIADGIIERIGQALIVVMNAMGLALALEGQPE